MTWRGRTWKRSGTIHISKETYASVQRDPQTNQIDHVALHRHTWKSFTYIFEETHKCVKRDPRIRRKRPCGAFRTHLL